MKKYLFAIIALGGAMTFAGCDKENGENKEPLPDPEITNETEIKDIPFTGGKFTYEFDANRSWKVSATDVIGSEAYEVELAPTSGEEGHSAIEITLPANRIQNEIVFSFTLTLLGENQTSEDAYSKEVQLTVPAPSVTDAAGNTYKAVYLKDGNYWMAENLRYVPEGITPSNDLSNVAAGVYYPIKLADDHKSVVFTTNESDIKASGYLYQAETAFGLAVNSIKTEDEAKKLEGTQGICPKGWHIPTADDIIGLVGKSVSPFELNDKAPYYDAEKKNATIEKLNADGFNLSANGAVSVVDNTRTSATLMGWLKANPDIIGSGYIYGSTFVSISYNTANDTASGIKNVQFLGIMPMANNGTANGSKISYKIGAAVRCVMDKAVE